MEPRAQKMSKKGIERDFTNEVIDFPDLPRAPSAEQMGCGGISDFALFMPFIQELHTRAREDELRT